MKRRMTALALKQKRLADQSGVSVITLRELQTGVVRDRQPSTLAAISRALQWPADALERIAEGEDPDEVIPQSQTVSPRGIPSGESWGTPTVTQSPPAPDVDAGLLVFASGVDVAGLDQDDVDEVQAVVDTMLDRLKARKQRGR